MSEPRDSVGKELQELRDKDPAEALRRVNELDKTPNGRATAAIILIDCGDALGDLSSISRGVDILETLSAEISFSPDIAYNLANGLQLRARLLAAAERPLRGQVADDRLRARILFGRVMNDSSASISTRSQMLTNIGILFLETHRWVEALDCFQHAQHILPKNAVAAFQEMRRLMALANLFTQREETYQSYCHVDALCQRVRQLATVVSENYDVLEEFAGAAAIPIAKQAVDHGLKFGEPQVERLDNAYFSDIRRNSLALSLHCSTQEFSSGRFDLLTIPHLQTTLEDGPDVPEIFAMMNVMKADFAFARQVFFDVREYDAETPYFETTSHADTLDYAVYGVRYSALTTAQRIAFDILDKISVAIACYLKLPGAHRASFTGIWGNNEKEKGFVFSKKIETELIGGNQPLMALFDIFQDVSTHESLGGGFLDAQRQFRNSSTHRFTVLHDMGHNHLSDSLAVEHKSLLEFEQLTLASLRLARAALFYFVDFIVFAEHRKERDEGKLVLSSEVPDYDYIRGRKG
ncbi:LA2681 family HEPN domain-containing protein [Stappia stellulata]|uniref:LA2681 family HEPN domain-containing protein n=1 Tax=Stappia stellulata TaxID=71235 RepID=UPI00041CA00D|nr:LA2681 family HEPN domain-containing protein [Stappia stellulata]